MCFSTVLQHPPKKTKGFGYKVFREKFMENGKYETLCHTYPNEIEFDKWLQAVTLSGHPDAGFHVYLSKKDARRAVGTQSHMFKVEYDEAIALGRGDGGFDDSNMCRVITAAKIRIIPGEVK